MSGNRWGLVLPRLNSVSTWPRGRAASTSAGPRKPVPPRMRLFLGEGFDSPCRVAHPTPDASNELYATADWMRVLREIAMVLVLACSSLVVSLTSYPLGALRRWPASVAPGPPPPAVSRGRWPP